LGLDEGDDVGYDLCGWTRQAFLGGFVDGAPPSSLVETVYFDATGGEKISFATGGVSGWERVSCVGVRSARETNFPCLGVQ
jgi:hypothetical protein